jgi:hypothetical protein
MRDPQRAQLLRCLTPQSPEKLRSRAAATEHGRASIATCSSASSSATCGQTSPAASTASAKSPASSTWKSPSREDVAHGGTEDGQAVCDEDPRPQTGSFTRVVAV